MPIRAMFRLLQSVLKPVIFAALACIPLHAAAQNLAIKAGTLHTAAGAPVQNAVVIITEGKIAAVGPAASVLIPEGYQVREAAIVTPGLVDPHSTVGLTGIYNSPHDSDQIERSSPIQPELRALDAYNPQEVLVEWLRSFGVTTAHTGHAPGELISGQTIVVKLRGNTVEEALLKSPAMVVATLGPESEKGGGSSPGTRGKQVAMLREQFLKAREYAAAKAKQAARASDVPADESDSPHAADSPHTPAPDASTQPMSKPAEPVDPAKSTDPAKAAVPEPGATDLKLELLADVLAGKLPLAVTANRAQDIRTALRLAEEFKFKLVLDGAAEIYTLLDEVKAAGVPILLHPTMRRMVGESENMSFETAATLAKANIPFAIQSGFEDYVPKVRVVLYEAAIAAANGLAFDQALKSITIDAARIIGVADRVGSIEVGKDGDLALYDGDPFEYTTHCVGVIIDGQVVSEIKR